VYDVTRRETFENLEDIWMREVDMYSTVEDAVKMVVANKVDLVRSVPLLSALPKHSSPPSLRVACGAWWDIIRACLATCQPNLTTLGHLLCMSTPVLGGGMPCTSPPPHSSRTTPNSCCGGEPWDVPVRALQEEQREVSKEEGHDFARRHGCLYVETSAKQNVAVSQAFEELVLKILETPSLLDSVGMSGLKISHAPPANASSTCSC
jgi:GTPase SAR1 family protein